MAEPIPIKEPEFEHEMNARVAALARRLSVRPRASSTCVIGLPGNHGEYYDWIEMCHAILDRLDGSANAMRDCALAEAPDGATRELKS